MARTPVQDALEWTAGAVSAQAVRPSLDELAAFEMLLDELRVNGALYGDDSQALTALSGKYKLLFGMFGLPVNDFRVEGSPVTEFDWLYWKAKLAMLRAAIEYLA
ncbi:hypothetical protein ACGYU5_15225 [Burkholderia pseudomallei]